MTAFADFLKLAAVGAGVYGVVKIASSSKSATTSTSSSSWEGTFGDRGIGVYRNGNSKTWGWFVGAPGIQASEALASGAEPSARAALLAVMRHVQESWIDDDAEIEITRGDGEAHGVLHRSANDAAQPWHWLAQRGPSDARTNAALGKAKTRGAAAIAMVDAVLRIPEGTAHNVGDPQTPSEHMHRAQLAAREHVTPHIREAARVALASRDYARFRELKIFAGLVDGEHDDKIADAARAAIRILVGEGEA